MTNPLFDYANASTYRQSSEIDQYDIAVIRDLNYTGTIDKKPRHLHFRSSDVQNLYAWQQGSLILKFYIKTPDPTPNVIIAPTTVVSDCRSFFQAVRMHINGVQVGDHNYPDIFAIVDRACYSEAYYKNVASEWFCDDVGPTTAGLAGLGRYHSRGAAPTQWRSPRPITMMTDPTGGPGGSAGVVASTPVDLLDNGFGRRAQLTNVNAAPGVEYSPTGRVVTAAIPLPSMFAFLRELRVALKNCQFEFKFEFHDALQPMHFLQYMGTGHGNTFTKDNGILFTDAYIEVPRISPSPASLIAVNNAYLNNPNIVITYPNYQVYQNTITEAAGVSQEFMVNNQTDRLLRYTAIMIPKAWETYGDFDARRSIHNSLRSFTLLVNGTRVPQSDITCSFSEGTPNQLTQLADGSAVLNGRSQYGAGQATGPVDVHTLYRNYLEMCRNYYLNNPRTTDGMYTMPFRSAGRLSLQEFAFMSPFVTIDLSRSAQNSEFIGGMSQIVVRLEFDKAPDATSRLYSIIESEQRVSISLSERAAFIETKLGSDIAP